MIRTSFGWNPALRRGGRTLRSLAIVVLAGLAAPGAAAAQGFPEDQPRENAVSVSIGLFRPADDAFRRVYGSRQVPFSVDASRWLWGGVSVFAGVRHARASGQAQPLGSGVAREENTVRLSTLTGRAGAFVSMKRADWVFEAGGGATIGRYTETWPDAPAEVTGAQTGARVRTTRIGALVRVGAGRSISRRLAIVGRVEGSFVRHAPGRQGNATVPRNLGGLESTVGMLLRF